MKRARLSRQHLARRLVVVLVATVLATLAPIHGPAGRSAAPVPILGAVPDLINAGLYTAEGDLGNAALAAAAAIPLAGDAIGAARMVVKYGDDAIALAGVVARHGDEGVAAAGAIARAGDDVAGSGLRLLDDAPAGSFSAATLVRTTDGQIPISEIDIGDEVLARDEASATTDAYPVSAVWSHRDAITGTVVIDGEPIAVTPEHPFRTTGRGWVTAAELRIGDAIVSLTGDPGIVEAITWDGGPDTMWNLTVATAHTYTVGDGGWLVHNACPSPNGRRGGKPHQDRVADVRDSIEGRGMSTRTELGVDVSGGRKGKRFVDVAAIDPVSGDVLELHQVGRNTDVGGIPVARERYAFDDIGRSNLSHVPVYSHPYN